jgi:hypothetical protein
VRLSKIRGLISKHGLCSKVRLEISYWKRKKQTIKYSAVSGKLGSYSRALLMAFVHYYAGCTEQAHLE